jgi:peptide/nickel transport system substrate-binding protein
MLRRTLLITPLAMPALLRPAAAQGARTLRVASPFEIGGLDPARSGHVFQRMQVAEALVGADEQGRVVPLLAAG